MTIKVRKMLLSLFVILFLILGGVLILYSNGWIFDFGTLKFSRLGAVYIETETDNFQMKIGKNEININPGLFQNGVLVANLVPKNYRLEITKENYQSWTKDIRVKPSLVVRTYPIVLFPNKWVPEEIYKNTSDFNIGSRYIFRKTLSGKLMINNTASNGDEFIDWLYGGSLALTKDTAKNVYFVINPKQKNTALNINLIFNNLKEGISMRDSDNNPKIIPHPYDGNKLIVSTINRIYMIDIARFTIQTISKEPGSIILAKNKKLFLMKKSGIYSLDLSSKTEKLITAEIAEKPELADLSPDSETLALLAGKKLFLINLAEPKVSQAASSVSYFKFSPDGEKIAFLENNNLIKILFLKDQAKVVPQKSGAICSLGAYSLEQDHPFEWYHNSAYLLTKHSNKLHLLEIDDRSLINQQDINIDLGKYFYDDEDNYVYFISSGSLNKIQFD
ncbi:MAG: hypothetical protein PHN74_01290 [Candidatus Pacebacteria bacterium]|nr:hypothetical protein [Candidatus Paceibacterota bacterium]